MINYRHRVPPHFRGAGLVPVGHGRVADELLHLMASTLAQAESLRPEHRLFAAALAWVALRAARPWRDTYSESEAENLLKADASRGLFDSDSCETVIAAARGKSRFPHPRSALLTPRECGILLEISRGASNKQVAQRLDNSPSTVRTHMESIFRKLDCRTRAAATLKGLTLGLIA